MNLISKGTLIKSLHLSNKHSSSSKTWSCRRNTVEDDNPKINLPPNMPCTFLFFKDSAFFNISFRENQSFGNVSCAR